MGLNDDNSCGDIFQGASTSKDFNCQDDDLLCAKRIDCMRHCESSAGLSTKSSHVVSFEDVEPRTEDFCSGRDEDVRSASCGPDAINDQGTEAVDSQTSQGALGLNRDMLDQHLDSRKHGRASVLKLSSSDEKGIKFNMSTEFDEMYGPVLLTSTENDDEYDVEEEDVKVCDICGDTGREDLLAVCSRCSDGAEHTYCMREMLDKVPEGDWFCEECKYSEQLEDWKQEQPKMLGVSERSKFLGRTCSVNGDLYAKVDSKDPFCERNKMKNVSLNKQVPSKRSGDSFETGPVTKKQALDSISGSPTISSPNRLAVLSKDNNSFKNLDKAKGKSTIQIATGTESTGDSSETVRSPTTSSLNAPKGNFSKSNSFSAGNSKLNVKVSDEVPQKQKQGADAKEGQGKLIAKSMSFKGLGRSTVSEPKVKMLSPNCTPVQEFKGQKQGRDRNLFERKSTIKLDHSIPGQLAAATGKRPSRGDITSSQPVLNHRDYKNCQSDGKLATLSKNACHPVSKFSDATANIGEVKKLSSTCTSVSVSINGASGSTTVKPIFPRNADRSVGANGAKTDAVDNQNETKLENSFDRSRQGVNAGMVGGNRRGLAADASVSRTREGAHKENKLKAAIEAAMLKKQDIFKKNRVPDKPIELSISNSEGNHVVDAVANLSRDTSSEEGMHEVDVVFQNHILNSCKPTSVGSTKPFKVYPADFAASIGESVLTVSPIPEQESVWQGVFEIHRGGHFSDMCGGFQAHLSSIASGKVLAAVKNFPQKIVMDEVPRSCVWPVQFKEIGAREDNIALYFFAKDLESYLRSYKMLLDYLIKHDLALRGNINGVELIVFSSNHLPDKFQCWNTLFFMWGVFRGKKPISSDNRSESLQKPEICVSNLVSSPKDIATAVFPDHSCLQRPQMEGSSAAGCSHAVVSGCDVPASIRTSPQQLGNSSDGDCYTPRCYTHRNWSSLQTSTENLQRGPGNYSSSSGVEACSESERVVLKDGRDQDPTIDIRLHSPTQGRGNYVFEELKSPSNLLQDRQDASSHSSEVPLVSEQPSRAILCSREQPMLDTANSHVDKVISESSSTPKLGCVGGLKSNRCDVKLWEDVKHDENETDTMWKNGTGLMKFDNGLKQDQFVDINMFANDTMKLSESLEFSPKIHSVVNSTDSMSLTASMISLQKRSWIDETNPSEGGGQSTSERVGNYSDGCDLSRLACSSKNSSQREDTYNADDEKLTLTSPGSAERYFFLVDAHPAESIQSEAESMCWQTALSEREDRTPNVPPNLELALGVEKKQSRSGVLPCVAGLLGKKDPDRPPDIVTPKEEDEDSSAALSLSLAFPFSGKERSSRLDRPPTSVEQTLDGRHELSTSLLLFGGSSHK